MDVLIRTLRPPLLLLFGGLVLALALALRIYAGSGGSGQAVIGVGLVVFLGVVVWAADRRGQAVATKSRSDKWLYDPPYESRARLDQTIADWVAVTVVLIIGLFTIQVDATQLARPVRSDGPIMSEPLADTAEGTIDSDLALDSETKLLILLGIAGVAYGATVLARLREDDAQLTGRGNDALGRSANESLSPTNSFRGRIVLDQDLIYFQSDGGRIELADDAARAALPWLGQHVLLRTDAEHLLARPPGQGVRVAISEMRSVRVGSGHVYLVGVLDNVRTVAKLQIPELMPLEDWSGGASLIALKVELSAPKAAYQFAHRVDR